VYTVKNAVISDPFTSRESWDGALINLFWNGNNSALGFFFLDQERKILGYLEIP
jgi:hypothetical protein